jgi:recombining binding protein suppressor of hairless
MECHLANPNLIERFLCPPPMATLIGRSWWTKDRNGKPINPPAVNISISQETPVGNAKAIWTTTHGRQIEEGPETQLNAREEPFVGRVGARNLHISEQSDKKRIVKAVVKVSVFPQPVPGQFGHSTEGGNVIGSFESKEIKIISKPSKKRQSTKTTERESTF